MRIKRILSIALVCSMMFSMPVLAEENIDEYSVENIDSQDWESIIQYEIQELEQLDSEQAASLFAEEAIQPYTTVPDNYEPNDTPATAFPYSQVAVSVSQLTNRYDLYRLGMREAGLHSEDDEDWYYVNMTAGEIAFIDLRNVGTSNWFIEIYYVDSDGTVYAQTTDPSIRPEFEKKPEKYMYIQIPFTGTYYIRIANGDDWSDEMYYLFYAGPYDPVFDIVNMPTYGGVQISGNGYRTYTCDLTGVAVPAVTEIKSLSITDSFPQGTVCSEVDKYISAGGSTYYSTSGSSSGIINGITNASLGQLWTIGVKCAQGKHYTYWSGKLNGRVRCLMAPYPGNEI